MRSDFKSERTGREVWTSGRFIEVKEVERSYAAASREVKGRKSQAMYRLNIVPFLPYADYKSGFVGMNAFGLQIRTNGQGGPNERKRTLEHAVGACSYCPLSPCGTAAYLPLSPSISFFYLLSLLSVRSDLQSERFRLLI